MMKVNVLSTAWSMTAISSPPVRQVMTAGPVQGTKYRTMRYGSVAPWMAVHSTLDTSTPATGPARALRVQLPTTRKISPRTPLDRVPTT
ncbi:hypothetical protein [Catenuloplanes nepalensis]|uniref:hypothetical protein n=1 Tax=Catenuloplanes nepalensis TaxID=587533 RepID=UPI0027D819EE|nr:hypothetical protein [Catenuloplanes nepalensis]